MTNIKTYEEYHSGRKLEKRVIFDYDFTHYPLIKVINDRIGNYKRVLDIGCGTGTVCFYFAKKGMDTVGVDISKNAVKMAIINSKNLNLQNKTKFVLSEFPKGTVDGKYDLIICSETLEHIDNDKQSISKIYSMLNNNGEVVFSVPLQSSLLFKYKLLNNFDKSVGHLRRYTVGGLTKLIKNSGFRIIRIQRNQGLLRDFLFTFPVCNFIVRFANRYRFFSSFLTFIDEKLLFLGASNVVVLAKKGK